VSSESLDYITVNAFFLRAANVKKKIRPQGLVGNYFLRRSKVGFK
jgi:hypothetical protein